MLKAFTLHGVQQRNSAPAELFLWMFSTHRGAKQREESADLDYLCHHDDSLACALPNWCRNQIAVCVGALKQLYWREPVL